jgi:hypothetical protein
MANLHAIHSVGHSLVTWLRNAYPAELREVTECEFLLLSSGEMGSKEERGPAVSLWLWRVTPNPHARSAAHPGSAARPALALDLHYLLTVWADSALAEHTLLAWALERMHGTQVLDASILSPEAGWERGDRVQLVPEELATEELLRIWDAMEPSYRLSVPFVARPVRILSEEAVTESLPVVATRFLYQDAPS